MHLAVWPVPLSAGLMQARVRRPASLGCDSTAEVEFCAREQLFVVGVALSPRFRLENCRTAIKLKHQQVKLLDVPFG